MFVNLIGGQDELVFDGNSFVMDATGEVTHARAGLHRGTVSSWISSAVAGGGTPLPGELAPLQGEEESVYGALVQGTRDYVDKHRFPGVVLGLSGGVDSALTLCIAVDALGAERVHSVAMPSRYTSQMSKDDAAEQAAWLHVKHSEISIEGHVRGDLGRSEGRVRRDARRIRRKRTFNRAAAAFCSWAFPTRPGRCCSPPATRAKWRSAMPPCTATWRAASHPSRTAASCWCIGSARWRNAQSRVIPARVIERPPSAELRFDQKDTDSLPPYEILDPILEAFIEEDLSVDQIAARGFDRKTVGRILDLVKRNEYKRRQAPPGVRVSGRAFGRDWRYPITSGYKSH